ncbi:retrotransposon gag protein [Tanacetum coccineum]
MTIEMTDSTKSIPKGIVENLLIKVDKFIFLVDFVILDMVEDLTIPIILGRTLLATAYAKVDVLKKMISLEEEIDYRCSMLDQEEPWEVETVKEPKAVEVPNKERDIDLSSVVKLKLDDDWFTETINNEDNLDGIVDYLELKSHDDFIDINDEAYKERMCKLLGMTYIKPSPILIKKIEVSRYTIVPGESYTKVMNLGIEEMCMNKFNVAAVRAELIKEMYTEGSVQRET